MMAVELCGASPAFAHPYTNGERDHALVSRTKRSVWAICPWERP
jgi:hypothetical protein